MATFFCDSLMAEKLPSGEVVYQAQALAVLTGEPVEVNGVDNLTLTGSADALFGFFGKVVELVAAPVVVGKIEARGDSGQVGN